MKTNINFNGNHMRINISYITYQHHILRNYESMNLMPMDMKLYADSLFYFKDALNHLINT